MHHGYNVDVRVVRIIKSCRVASYFCGGIRNNDMLREEHRVNPIMQCSGGGEALAQHLARK